MAQRMLDLGGAMRGAGGYARKKMPFLHSKFGPSGYYKGKGARRMGRHTSMGNFKLDPNLVPNYVVPDITGFHLKPYVDHRTPKIKIAPPPIPKYIPLEAREVNHVWARRVIDQGLVEAARQRLQRAEAETQLLQSDAEGSTPSVTS
eukprot:CAMPEP_0185836058 /NCGR_PEP_ID=MMETSP1353-20130828/9017_1 /TAXON_ID=1077150 /ORGANISM="Erythrolobus australicus, Strain CCMP3124" /LENGTH=146 /DNA_ID=CAMNT_0028534799 /DNA_START=11 /DNA_END=451 /DNA_ORIENTATION=+